MSLKTIMLALMPSESAAPPPLLRPTLDLAEANKAHLSLVVGTNLVQVGIALPYAPAAGYLTEENKRRVALSNSLAEAILQATAIRGISASSHPVTGAFDDMAAAFVRHGRLHDLVVSPTPKGEEVFHGSLASALLFETGRPVLFMPETFAGPFDLDHVVVAWDGGQQAARAVGDAMLFIETAKSVSIVCVTGEKDLSTVAGGELAARLAHHGPEVIVVDLPVRDHAGETLLDYARGSRAGLIVMGAFARSRWRELILGGVTSHMLSATDIPVLMAH